MDKTTKAKLSLIIKKAARDRTLKFNALIHLLNDEEYLYECFKELERGKAAGVDTRTKESYTEAEIRQAITDIVQQLKTRKYRPQPVRRVFIPKSNGKFRPLGIPTVMDKVIQLAVAKILEPIFEPVFLNTSYGYRPNRNAHEALKAVNDMLMGQKVNWVVDADIKAFFDNVNHDWMMECLKQRITDPNFLTLIRRMLKAGVITEGVRTNTEQGTPQGGIISPILANIYLHYVLDLWLEKKLKPNLNGYAGMARYADDFVIGCQYHEQAHKIVQSIKDRFAKFGLMLSEDKTRVIEFGRFARERRQEHSKGRPETFTFLGFTHYCGTTRKGAFVVRHKTSRQKYQASVKRLKEWMRSMKNMRALADLWNTLSLKLQGHYQYYGMSGNTRKLQSFYFEAERLAFKWLNRRSQRKSWNWQQFHRYLERYPLPKPRIAFALYNTSW
jgi:group II intron reverse transcriptase/maturase